MNEHVSSAVGLRVSRFALLAAVGFCFLLGATSAWAHQEPSSSAAAAQGQLLVGPNYRLGTDVTPGRGKDGIGFALDPRNARHIVELNADWQTGQCEYHTSFDGGNTWRDGAFRVPAGFNALEPCTIGHHLAGAIQAGVAYGSGGNVYATFVSAAPAADGAEQQRSLFVVVSRDGGRTFETAKLLAQAGASSSEGADYELPTVGVDPARRGGPGRDRVFVAAHGSVVTPGADPHNPTTTSNITMSTSGDSGATWSPVFNANAADENAAEQSQIVVGRDGTAYLAWRDAASPVPPATTTTDGFIVVAKSRDGRTWTRKNVARVQGYTYTGPLVPPFTGSQSFGCCNYPRIALDPKRNDVYVVYGQGPPPVSQAGVRAHGADHFINPAMGVFFTRSTNAGATWSVPVQINHPAPGSYQIDQTRHPSVSVAPNGRVDIVWQDRRHWYHACVHTHVACQEARLGDTYYGYSTNQGRSFSPNYRISDRSTNNDVGYDYRFGTYWAYGPAVVPLGNNRLLVGWMDSREGNFQNDSQDIYLSQLTVAAPGAAAAQLPARRMTLRGSASDYSTQLSRLAYPAGPEAVLASTFATRPFTRVVIVNEGDVAGALAAGVLARANLATVLLSPSSGLTPAVKTEIARLGPVGAYIVGNEAALPASVSSDLTALGVPSDQIVRLAGANPADAAAQIANATDRRSDAEKAAGAPAFDAAIIANPNSREAGAAAALAAARRMPILYVSRDAVPAETTAALTGLHITRTLVIGGPGVVSDAVAGTLPGAQRVGGSDAFTVSRNLLGASIRRDVASNVVYVTDGSNQMQTALLGPALGRIGGLELIARGRRAAVDKLVNRWLGSSDLRLFLVGAAGK
jgi:putative cell wall-binding protein